MKQVGIRSTSVLTRDNIVITIPNSVLNDTRVVNQSAPERRTRVCIPIGVAYGTDIDEVDEILLDVCDSIPHVLDTPAPRVLFKEFGDSALIFDLRVHTSHPFQDNRVRDEVNRAVYQRFNEAGIEIPYPQRTVHTAAPNPDYNDVPGTGEETQST